MYSLPKLNFAYDALEPFMDKENLEIHHAKHHNTYVTKFNAAVAGTEYDKKDLKDILVTLNSVPESLRNTVRNMGGGAWNHSFFWECLCPASQSGQPGMKTAKMITEAFGSFEEFKKQFTDAAVGVFGSGWAWLVVGKSGKLEIVKTANQDCPLTAGQKPILTIDVWEHAYYLKYKNLRPDFVAAFFNLVDWEQVEQNLLN